MRTKIESSVTGGWVPFEVMPYKSEIPRMMLGLEMGEQHIAVK